MNNDFMRWLMEHRLEGNGTTASAADNPHDWVVGKLEENAEYAFVNDRSLAADSHNYSVFDVELDFRF